RVHDLRTTAVTLWSAGEQTHALSVGYSTPGGSRTPDQRIRNPPLYPTELRARGWGAAYHEISEGTHPKIILPLRLPRRLWARWQLRPIWRAPRACRRPPPLLPLPLTSRPTSSILPCRPR